MKKYLSIMLAVLLLFAFAGCASNKDVTSEPVLSSTESVVSDESSASKTTIDNSEVTSAEPSSSNSQNTPSSQPDTTDSTPTLTAREKMNGEWRFIMPENKHTTDVYAFVGHRLVYDLTISDDNTVTLSEKHYMRSDTETIGAVEYFEGKRYTLAYASEDVIKDSFLGEMAISPENENIAILTLKGYEIATGQQYIEEKHYLTLTDDGNFSWAKAELLSKTFDKQYFPWDKDTVFAKK